MHQKLINHRGKINIEDIKVFAKEIDIDPELLINNINSSDIGFIEENYRIADKLNINGTFGLGYLTQGNLKIWTGHSH